MFISDKTRNQQAYTIFSNVIFATILWLAFIFIYCMCKCIYRQRNQKERGYWENLNFDARIVLKCILEEYGGGTALINLALDIVQWRAFDSVVMNFGLDL
jgi:hypothetical protein